MNYLWINKAKDQPRLPVLRCVIISLKSSSWFAFAICFWSERFVFDVNNLLLPSVICSYRPECNQEKERIQKLHRSFQNRLDGVVADGVHLTWRISARLLSSLLWPIIFKVRYKLYPSTSLVDLKILLRRICLAFHLIS